MPTIGEAIGSLEEDLFVDRERELAIFREWLEQATPVPEILNVSGRGGIGKSALLRAFTRIARHLGKPVVFVDCENAARTPETLLSALGGSALVDTLAHLNETRPLILLDTVEELGELARYLREDILAGLATGVKVVIAGRYPLGLAWTEDSPWRRIIHPLSLGSLSTEQSREYLRRRGLTEPALIDQIIGAAGGNPLALALAADLALHLGIRHFAAAAERHLVIRALVERLLRDVKDPQLRELLDVCAVVRQFDEATLAAIAGRTGIGTAFAQLCRLSVVRPAEHGLMLHDDVRRMVADDLRWRRPDHFAELRRRALAYYRERSRTSPPAEREWLVAERLFLWEDGLIQAFFFTEEEPGQVWVESCRPTDQPAIHHIRSLWIRQTLGIEQPSQDRLLLDQILGYPGARCRIARDRDGRAVGYGAIVPVCQESWPILRLQPTAWELVRARWGDEGTELPPTAENTTIFWIQSLSYVDEQPCAVRAALVRDLFGILACGGIYLVGAVVPAHKVLLETLGFQHVPAARDTTFFGEPHPMDGYVLDLSRIGLESWIEAIISGRRPPRVLDPAELERELQTVLLHWHDDARLAASQLVQLPPVAAGESGGQRAELVRRAIFEAFRQARSSAPPSDQLAYRALELAYVQRATSQELAAERLNVSRATFYRLLKRGIQGVAKALQVRE